MAEKKPEGKGGEKKPKVKKLKLKHVGTDVADDGTFVHHHHYADEHGHIVKQTLGGTSADMKDLHRHMDDHLGPEAEQGDDEEQPGGEGEEDDEEAEGAAPAAGAAPAPPQG